MSTVAWAVAESIAGPVGENNAVVAVMEGTQQKEIAAAVEMEVVGASEGKEYWHQQKVLKVLGKSAAAVVSTAGYFAGIGC